MKTRIFAAVAAVVVSLATGCGAFYGNEKQYDEGDWYLLASSAEVARIKEDKLALAKLEAQNFLVSKEAATKGLKVIVANMDHYRSINTKLFGPESGHSYLLAPNGWEEIYLITGTYMAVSYYGSEVVGVWKFKVGPPIKKYLGKEVYGYTYFRGY